MKGKVGGNEDWSMFQAKFKLAELICSELFLPVLHMYIFFRLVY